MADSITFFETVDKKVYESGRTLWTNDHDFDPPNSHGIEGVLKLDNDIWKIRVALTSNLEDAELVWPAEIKWKLSVVKGRRSKLLGSQDGVTWTQDDLGKCDWERCIEVSHSDLKKGGMIDDDGSVTFMWFVQLTVKSVNDSSPGTVNVEARSGHKTVRGADMDAKYVVDKQCDASLLLVGKTGVGKSATGNNILNLKWDPFHVDCTDTSVTTTVQFEYSRYQGRTIKVVDMPSLSDSRKDQLEDTRDVIQEAVTAVSETPDGYDAILVVVKFGRQSREDKETIESLKMIFGEKFIRDYGILVVTHGDNFKRTAGKTKSISDYCSAQEGLLNQLWKECNRRVVLFDNETNKDEEKESHRKKLFDILDAMRCTNRYTPEIFEAAKAKRDELIAKVEELVLTDEMKSTMWLIINDLNSVMFSTPGDSTGNLKELKTRAKEFIATTLGQGRNGKFFCESL